MWRVAEYLVTAFFFVWIAASVASQRKRVAFLHWDFLGLLPDFRFFAPHPVSRDLSLYVRAGTDGSWDDWVEFLPPDKKWWCFAWHPEHRLRKAVFDLYRYLDRFRATPEIWHVCPPYLTLLNAASTVAGPRDATRVQFMIACHAGYEEATHDILFVSHPHRVD